MYEITPEQYDIAKDIGVYIFPSDKKKYKLDVYTNEGAFFTSIGSSAHKDYFIYDRDDGKDVAENRRRLFKLRTEKKSIVGNRTWLARKLLWGL
jgi:hypothetical protein